MNGIAAAAGLSEETVALVFADIAIIIIVARLVGALFRRIGQPPVVGEIIAGILLGPTLLGDRLPEEIFPSEGVRPALGIIAQLGLIVFMFIVGLELDMSLVRGKVRVASVISVTSVVVPFSLGFLLAGVIHEGHDLVDGEQVKFVPFALFIGAAMSITAFPVLARILSDRGMQRTQIGVLVLACAAVDDILAWSLLAVVLAVVGAGGVTDLPLILGESIAFIAAMFLIVRPQLRRLVDAYQRAGRLTPNILAVVLIGMLLSAYLTSQIGIHSIFGAFIFGAIMPREGTAELFHEILQRLENVTVLLLLPVFFIATGLRVDLRGIDGEGLWELLLILAAAIAGKFLGATGAARAQGIPLRRAAAIGTLMNTRGLTELVILNIGLDEGVLDDELFTLMVVMAVVTTVMTGPILKFFYPDRLRDRDIAEAERARLGQPDAYRVLVAVNEPEDAERLLDVAVDIVGDERPAEVVLTRFLRTRDKLEVGSGLAAELAEMTSVMDELHAAERRVEARDVPCTVTTSFSNDIAEDLVRQAENSEANVLLATVRPHRGDDADHTGIIERVVERAACMVAVLSDGDQSRASSPRGRPVLVLDGAGPDHDAAVEIGLRVARSASSELVLLADSDGRHGRRTARLLNELKSLVSVRAADATAPEGDGQSFLVGPLMVRDGFENRGRAGVALLVRASSDSTTDALAHAVERVRDRAIASGSVTGRTG